MVTMRSQARPIPGTHAHFAFPCLISNVTQSVNAIAASSWLAMPKSGKSWSMPPSGSVTPTYSM